MRCGDCSSLHRELPNFILPFKHYISSVIEAAIESRTAEISAEDSTIRRWQRWFQDRQVHFWGVLSAVAATHGTHPPQSPGRSESLLRSIREHLRNSAGWLAQMVRITVNTHNWICTEFAWVTADQDGKIMA